MNEEIVEPIKTIRELEIERLQGEIAKAAKSKRFIESEEGSYVINYISEVVSSLTNQLINKRQERDDYIEIRAKIDVLRRLKQALESQSSDVVLSELSQRLALAESGD
mgnify:FL=1